jgi:Ca2+-binding RTX toxin-like protein
MAEAFEGECSMSRRGFVVQSQLTGPRVLLASRTSTGAYEGFDSRRWYPSSLFAGLAALGLLLAVTLATLAPSDSNQFQASSQSAISPLAPSLPQPSSPASPGQSKASSDRAEHAYAKLPLSFVPNAGQADGQIRYYAQGGGFSFSFMNDKAVLAFEKGDRGQALELRFLGANPNAKVTAADRGEGSVNYLVGSKHQTNLPTYGQLVYRDLWPGIDMVFLGKGGRLVYEFNVHRGANPNDIRLAYKGANGLSLGAGGGLSVDTPLGDLRDAPPQSFQRIDGKRVDIASRYALSGDSYGFALGRYDRSQPLVIDPSLAYSTYLGGSATDASDEGRGIAVDSNGAAYVTGYTVSSDFPTTAGAFETTPHEFGSDVFVTKLNPTGSSLAYSTFLGGSSNEAPADGPVSIAVDSQGAAYVSGETTSTDFPTTGGAYRTTLNADADPNTTDSDVFVTKLDPTGSSLAYSTYLGGTQAEGGGGIAVDSSGAAYVTGATFATDFPTTAGAFDTTFNGSGVKTNAFVTKLDSTGSSLAYSTYLGGNGTSETGRAIAVDSQGAAYATGVTNSTNFPTTAGAFDTSANGSTDPFVTKLDPTGASLTYSTYLGGNTADYGNGIAVDSQGAAFIAGTTSSTNYPTTAGAFDTSFNFNEDTFVTKLNAAGSSLAYSAYLGGGSSDLGRAIAIDSQGNAYVAGNTGSTDFPTTADALDTTGESFGSEAFVTKVNAAGSTLVYSSYLGGSSPDTARGIAIDSVGAAYLTGYTLSTNFPTTAGTFDTSANGGGDAFVTKYAFVPICNGKLATIVGTTASETLTGTAGDDVIVGLGGNDTISGAGGNDTICGGDGNDTLNGGTGANFQSGGTGTDTATYATRTTAVTLSIDGVANDGTAGEGDNIQTDVENVTGGSGNDTLSGSSATNKLTGGGGADSLAGAGGNDTLDGGTGSDVLGGGTGTDTATYATRTTGVTVTLDNVANDGDSSDGNADNVNSDIENVTGGSGNDTLTGSATTNTLDGQNGADVLSGLGGIDTATYATRTSAVTVTLDNAVNDGNSADGSADNVKSDIENLIGGSGADTLTGSASANTLDGGNGADVLSGLGGIDTATYATRTTGVTVTINGVANDGNSSDGSTKDNVKADVENVIGGKGADSLTGSAANNRLTGGLGADSLSGLGGNDTLLASDGIADTTIDCGVGATDTADVDSLDPATVGCESRTWNFDVDGDLEGWTPMQQIDSMSVSGGALNGTSTGVDPFMYGPTIARPATDNKVTVRLRNGTPSSNAQVFFTTSADQTWDEAKSKRITIAPNSGFTTYTFDMSTVPAWTGTITQLRLDPAEAAGTFSVDWIRIGNY